MIDISIEEAMRCLQFFQERHPENGYVFQCFNIGISALQTIKDGNYIIEAKEMETMIKKIANYDCTGKDCNECPYYQQDSHKHSCISITCEKLLLRKEIETWVHEHWNELKTL